MSLHVLAYNIKRVIAIIGVGPLMAAIRNLIVSLNPTRQSINTASTVMDRKHSAPPTSYDAFFHGLGRISRFDRSSGTAASWRKPAFRAAGVNRRGGVLGYRYSRGTVAGRADAKSCAATTVLLSFGKITLCRMGS